MKLSMKGLIAHMIMRVCAVFPIQKKAVFTSHFGDSYSGNPQIIYEVMKDKATDYKYIWLMADTTVNIEGAQIVKYGSISSIYHMATAKLWVDNYRKREWVCKRKGQYYVQTWHGGIALKKVEKDVEDKLEQGYINSAKNDSNMADLFISGSKWRTNNYKEAFWYKGEVLEVGLPKADIFYQDSTLFKEKVYKYYSLSKETRLVLYAPTFRKDGNLTYYDIDYEKLLQCLKEKWGGSWKVLVRLHPNIQNKQDAIIYNESVLNASAYNDISELEIACDLLITDYSGCMFEAMEAGKRVILYATDVENYMKNERGSYFSLEELPFLLAQNKNELEECIIKFEQEKYQNKVNAFMERIGCVNNSCSGELVVNHILNRINL